MTSALGHKTIQRLWAAVLMALVMTMAIASVSSATARTCVSLHVGIPLYAGPPAYYYGPYYAPYAYAPAPIYYNSPPPEYYAPPAVAVPNCSNGRWRQTDGSIVSGIACLQPDGTWRLANY